MMDSVTTGIVADICKLQVTQCVRKLIIIIVSGKSLPAEPSSYIATLLKDTTSSHLLETVLTYAPQPVFDALWATHLCPNGAAGKLAVHPVSNYVLARAVPRANEAQLESLGRSWWSKAVKAGRMGVVKAVVDRAAELKQGAEGLWASVKDAFGVGEDHKTEEAINCVLCLKTVEVIYLPPSYLYRDTDGVVCRTSGLQRYLSLMFREPYYYNLSSVYQNLTTPSSLKTSWLFHYHPSSRSLTILSHPVSWMYF